MILFNRDGLYDNGPHWHKTKTKIEIGTLRAATVDLYLT